MAVEDPEITMVNTADTHQERLDTHAEMLELVEQMEADEAQKLGEVTNEADAQNQTGSGEGTDSNQQEAGSSEVEGSEATQAPEGDSQVTPQEPVASGWELVRQQERALREQRAQFQRERHELQQQMQQLEDKRKQSVDFESQLKQDPFGTLEKAGLRFDALARKYLDSDTAPVPGNNVKPAENQELKALREEFQQMRQQLQKATEEQHVQQFHAQVRQTLQGDQYKLLRTDTNAQQAVQDYCVEYYKRYGEPADLTEACNAVQDTYREHIKSLGSIEAIREVLVPGSATSEQSQTPKPPQNSEAPRNITPSMSSGLTPRKLGGEPLSYDVDDETAEAYKLLENVEW